jgi:hypothetical protein
MKTKNLTEDESELVTRLNGWKKTDCILLAAIQEAVGPNTFRAFAGLESPAKVFRGWAQHWLIGRNEFQKLSELKDLDAYDKWLKRCVSSLQRYWQRKTKSPLNIGPAYKLANLLMKRTSQELPGKHKAQVFKWLHVPLDRYTLAAIRVVIVLPGDRSIPVTAGMAFIDNFTDYCHIQRCIRKFARNAGVPPIALDYIAYNQR